MATPKTVQRQLEQAEAMLAAQTQQVEATQQPVVTDAAQLLAQAPMPAPAHIANPEIQPPADPPKPAVDYEQKFKTIEGMYRKEVPELRTKVATYESEMTALKEQVRALTAAAQKATEPKKATVDPKDVESFGADMVDMVQRYAQQTFSALRDEFAGYASDIDKRVKALEETVTGVRQTTDSTLSSQFYATLKQLVPDWETINVGDDWLAWLAEVDPVYRVPRQAALDAAHQRRDVEGVAAVFNAFKSTRKAKPSAALEAQRAPSTTPAAPVATSQSQQLKAAISSKFVRDFYTDIARGRYKGREKDAEAIEAQINQAAAEGRIV